MFALKSLSKYLFSANNKESLIEIPEGKLYLVRPNSLKGASELIFKDSVASIRRTAKQFHYQLVIQRAYEEGEAELLEDEGDTVDPDDPRYRPDKDERTFLLHEDLRFRGEISDNGESVFAWNDLSGDPDDVFEFVCDTSVKPETATTFSTVAAQCQFERKYQLPQDKATEKQLQEFQYTETDPIPQASPVTSPTRSPRLSPATNSRNLNHHDLAPLSDDEHASLYATPKQSRGPRSSASGRMSAGTPTTAPSPLARPQPLTAGPAEVEAIISERAELHMFDVTTGTFVMQNALVTAKVSDLGKWTYWLRITSTTQEWIGISIDNNLNPVFNFEYLSFIFNRQDADGRLSSWLLRFSDHATVERFQEGFARALWEHTNHIKWAKAKADTQDFVLDSFDDLVLEDEREAEAREEDEALQEEEEELDHAHDDDTPRNARFGDSRYDDDGSDEDDEVKQQDSDGHVNSQLAVGASHDRSFVVRGSKIGVFKHTNDNRLEFDTNISRVATPKGKLFSPTKVMLHENDRNMILSNDNDPNSLYRMDLEYGKVVDEWKVHDDIPVKTFAPTSKFSQLTGEQTFVGLSNNSMFRVDPRQAGHKLVDDELKTYAGKTGFAAAATTDKGYIAVASNSGEIRLFDRIGINAKAVLPSIGDPIIGLDVSADGRWVLGTTKTYILLIDSLHAGGKDEGKVGFQARFLGDSKPRPRKLQIKPEHSQQFQHETGKPLSFTTARFNTGEGKEESTIVTSTGPYIVTWSLKKLLRGTRDPYSIKRYDEDIMADNFRYGSDKNIVVALPNEVGMVAKRALKRPTRESIMATPKRGSSRQSHLRDEIVNSPY